MEQYLFDINQTLLKVLKELKKISSVLDSNKKVDILTKKKKNSKTKNKK